MLAEPLILMTKYVPKATQPTKMLIMRTEMTRQITPHILISFGQPLEKREAKEQQHMQEPTIMMVAISPVLWGEEEREGGGH